MANLYGVANPVPLPVVVSVGTSVVCPANTATIFLTSPALVQPSQGYFYPILWLTACINYGATAPGLITITAQIGAGSAFDTYVQGGIVLYDNSSQIVSVCLVGPLSQVTWQSPGSVVNVLCNPATNGVTMQQGPTRATFALFRAPDQ